MLQKPFQRLAAPPLFCPILFGRDSLIFAKLFDEETGIVIAAMLGNFCNSHVGRGQKITGALNAIVVHIVNGGSVNDGFKIAAEIFGGKPSEPGQALQ